VFSGADCHENFTIQSPLNTLYSLSYEHIGRIMSVWGSVAKQAKSWGAKGFLYGAAIGAVLAVTTVLVIAAVISGLGAANIIAATAALGTPEMLGAGAQLLANGLESLSWPLMGGFAAGGAVAGAGIGAVGCATAGGIYGAATDESNPLPRILDSAANRILTKTPALAKAIAAKVEMQEAANDSLYNQGGVTSPESAPIISIGSQSAKQPTNSFQEKLAESKLTPPELSPQR
jgi:hypothetical protein